jgi:holo-[acyl-carrier protein] synthase
MILSVGLDIIEVKRIEQSLKTWKGRFREKYFTQSERDYCSSKRNPAQHYAARFAAKEAVYKAFGGPWPSGCGHLDIEVTVGENGKPSLKLSDNLFDELKKTGITKTHLSLTHTNTTAAAVVIFES